MTFLSRNPLSIWTSTDSSDPNAAVAMTQRSAGRVIVEMLVLVLVIVAKVVVDVWARLVAAVVKVVELDVI